MLYFCLHSVAEHNNVDIYLVIFSTIIFDFVQCKINLMVLLMAELAFQLIFSLALPCALNILLAFFSMASRIFQ